MTHPDLIRCAPNNEGVSWVLNRSGRDLSPGIVSCQTSGRKQQGLRLLWSPCPGVPPAQHEDHCLLFIDSDGLPTPSQSPTPLSQGGSRTYGTVMTGRDGRRALFPCSVASPRPRDQPHSATCGGPKRRIVRVPLVESVDAGGISKLAGVPQCPPVILSL